MKKLMTVLLACVMIISLAVVVSAYWEPEEAFGEVKFTIGKQTTAWNADGQISDGEYYKVELDPSWISYAINDNDTDAGLEYAKATHPELYMSWDENYIYTATRYEVTKGHENLWDGDPASMWYSGAVQFNYANFDEVASEYRLEYGVGLSSDTGDTLYTVWADGAGTGFTPSEENAKVWLDGNTLTYETRVAWEDFADEDNTAGKEGLGFNFCLVWSIGEGQDYVHIQLAEGCTGNGKHAENFAQVTLGPAQAASAAATTAKDYPVDSAFIDQDALDADFWDDPDTLFEGGSGQPIQYVNGYGVGYSSLNDQVIYEKLDFGENGADKMIINFSNGGADDTTLAVYIDEKSGTPAATYTIPNTGGWEETWAEEFETAIDVPGGRHTVIVEFTNSNSGSFTYIRFHEKSGDAAPAAAAETSSAATAVVGKNGEYDDIQLPGTKTAPAIDGKLDDCYVKIHDFYSPDEEEWYDASDAAHAGKGEAWATWDKDNFYTFFKVYEPEYFPQNAGGEVPAASSSSMYLALLATKPVDDLPENDNYVLQVALNRSSDDTLEWKYTGSVPEEFRANSADLAMYDETPFTFECINVDGYTYYEIAMPWDQIDRTGDVPFGVGHEFTFNYIVTYYDDEEVSWPIVQYGQGLMNDIYDMGGIITMVAAPDDAAAAPAEEAPAEPIYTYPASGTEGNAITGTVIGNATGWGDNADAGAAAAFDGNPATFFDPLGVGDGFCGIDAGESYVLDKVVILSRDGFNDRFVGAMIQGSNDGENWTTLWTSDAEGTYPDYCTVTEFENNTGYSQFRYYNETNHGDVAEVEFYGQPGKVEEAPAEEAPAVENYALGARVIVTSTETDDFPGELAVDGNKETRWASAYNDGEEITIDLGKAKAVNYIALYWETAMASDYVVYGSTDPNDFYQNELASVSGNTENENVLEFGTTPAQYITIQCTKRATEWGNSLYEVVVSGEGDASVDQALDQKAEAPNTFDFGVIAAVASVISLAGFAAAKKRH